jgi:hypothetical protein
MCSLFSSILKHRDLNDPGGKCIIVKGIPFKAILAEGLLSSTISGIRTIVQQSTHEWNKVLRLNPFLDAQKFYFQSLMDFIPLLEHFIDLAPHMVDEARAHYIRASQEILYKNMFKQFQKESSSLNSLKPLSLSLESSEKYSLLLGHPPQPVGRLFYRIDLMKTNDLTTLHSWIQFELALWLSLPLLSKEYDFFQVN